MNAKHIVVDWNGTVFGMPDDNVLIGQLGKAVLRGLAAEVLRGRLRALRTLGRSAMGLMEIRRVRNAYDRREVSLADLYELVNRHIIRAASPSMLERTADAYGAQFASRIDKRMVQPLADARARGSGLFIFSAAFDRGIRAVLGVGGFGESFDELVCNVLEQHDGRALGLTKRFRDDKAGDFKAEFLERRGWSPSEIIYAGDGSVDEPIARLLPRGHFIVPFLATDAFREHMSRHIWRFRSAEL